MPTPAQHAPAPAPATAPAPAPADADRAGAAPDPCADSPALQATRRWLERAVIGLNLCPFARAVHLKRQIRWAESAARDERTLLRDLSRELLHLADADPATTDTTLLVHPGVLRDFADYNDFLDVADELLVSLDLEGVLQVASFHPDYRFAGTAADDAGNLTNRSPHPTLHLLREDSLERAITAFPLAEDIFERNIRTLQALGHAGFRALFAEPGG